MYENVSSTATTTISGDSTLLSDKESNSEEVINFNVSPRKEDEVERLVDNFVAKGCGTYWGLRNRCVPHTIISVH